MTNIILRNKFHLLFSFAFFIFSSSEIYSQKCDLIKIDQKFYDFSKYTLVNNIYKTIQSDSSSNYHVFLFDVYGDINKVMLANITEANPTFLIERVNNDSIVEKKNIENTPKLVALLNELKNFSGYYMGACQGSGNSHVREVLIIANNKSKLWIEITSVEGDLFNILKTDVQANKLFEIYQFIKEKSHWFLK